MQFTVYICDFSGQFSELVKVNEYTWATNIQEMELEKEPDTTEIIDGIRYICSEPYGLYGAERILFYLEGAPLDELPEEYRSWVGYYDYEVESSQYYHYYENGNCIQYSTNLLLF